MELLWDGKVLKVQGTEKLGVWSAVDVVDIDSIVVQVLGCHRVSEKFPKFESF